MSKTLGFLIKDADEDSQIGVTFTTSDDSLDFDGLKKIVEAVVQSRNMRDKFDLPMADYETTYDIDYVAGVAIGRFTFTNVKREDWATDAVHALRNLNVDCNILSVHPVSLARIILRTEKEIGLDDIAGPWRGIVCLHHS